MQRYHYSGGGANKSNKEAKLLQRKYELFDTEVIPQIFKEVLNESVLSYSPVKNSGIPHVTFEVKCKSKKKYALRANIGYGKPEVTLVTEKLLSDLALENNIPSNKIIYVDISRNKFKFDFQIQEFLNGLDPEIDFRGTVRNYDTLSFSIGEAIAKMSNIALPGFGHFKESCVKKEILKGESRTFVDYIYLELFSQIEKIVNHKYLSSTRADKIIKLFEKSKPLFDIQKGNMVHYDIADHNIRYNPKTYKLEALFDWEAAVVGDSMLDIGSAPTWKTLYERESKVIEGYKSIKALPDNYRDKIDIYRLRTVIWKFCHNIKNNLVTPERIARIENSLLPFKI